VSGTATIDRAYLSPPEAAELLRVSPNKILAWIVVGELRAADCATHRDQRPRWRIGREDLDSFLARRSTSPPPEPRRRRRRQQDHVIPFY